jgi:Domain of unknown function (DUF4157)/Lysine-specific metallo-endopeptidase
VRALLQTPMPAPAPVLQRRCACGGTPGPDGECAACKAKRLRRQAVAQGPQIAPPIVHDVLRSTGRPLEPAARAQMEAHFGHDFSRVRVHTDAAAAESARAVGAAAYTVGRDVVFDAGRYSPQTQEGGRLLAHELAHTVQQASAPAVGGALGVASAADHAERQADDAARLAFAGAGPSPMTSTDPVVARQPAQPAPAQPPAAPAPAAPAQVPGCALSNCSGTQQSTITGASGDLQRAIGYIDTTIAALNASPLAPSTERLLRWYFTSANNETVSEVTRRLSCVRDCLVDTDTNSRFGCDLPYHANAYVEVDDTPVCVDALVPVCYTAQHFGHGPAARAGTSIHECAHRMGMSLGTATSTDDIYANTRRFLWLSRETALVNSDSFALFVRSMADGTPVAARFPGFQFGAGPAVALAGGETTWHVRAAMTAELQHPVLGLFSPTLGLSMTLIGAPETSGSRSSGVSNTASLVTSLIGGIRIGDPRPGPAGGGYVSFFGGPALSTNTTIEVGAEAGVALGYRWRWLDLSAGAGYTYSPASPPGLEHIGTATFSITVTPFVMGGK